VVQVVAAAVAPIVQVSQIHFLLAVVLVVQVLLTPTVIIQAPLDNLVV
jgi:hypothetical protein